MEETKKGPGLVYPLPAANQFGVQKGLVYKHVDHKDLKLDVYYPASIQEGARLPAVVFVHGERAHDTPPDLKDHGQYTGWGKLVAGSGMIGITFNHRPSQQYTRLEDPASDITDLLAYARTEIASVDSERMGVWVCSAGGATGMTVAMKNTPAYIRCIVAYYAIMDPLVYRDQFPDNVDLTQLQVYSPISYLSQKSQVIAPLFIVRAGQDRGANRSLDPFVQEALKNNVAFELINYAQGHHGFDTLDDTEETRKIIKRTLFFMQERLFS